MPPHLKFEADFARRGTGKIKERDGDVLLGERGMQNERVKLSLGIYAKRVKLRPE
jgi:hypothetical protein